MVIPTSVSVHIFETLRGDKISSVKGGHPKEGQPMEGPYPNRWEVSKGLELIGELHPSLLKITAKYGRMDEDPQVSGFGRWNLNINNDNQLSLGARGPSPSGYIVITLWFFKQCGQLPANGDTLSSFMILFAMYSIYVAKIPREL